MSETTNPLPGRMTLVDCRDHKSGGIRLLLGGHWKATVKRSTASADYFAHELVRRFNAFVDLAEPNNVLITTPEKWQALNDSNAALVAAVRGLLEEADTSESFTPDLSRRLVTRATLNTARAALRDAEMTAKPHGAPECFYCAQWSTPLVQAPHVGGYRCGDDCEKFLGTEDPR